MNQPAHDDAIFAIERPHPSLWTYYWVSLLAIPPLFPILILPMYFRYHTMRYKFTPEGISMSWGILFRREIIVNYARIQDIHLRSNIIERWLGLAKVLVQTASGSASAELTIEGVREYEALRDFLYAHMRGVKDHGPAHPPATGTMVMAGPSGVMTMGSAGGGTMRTTAGAAGSADELAAALRETAAELRALREELARRPRG